MSVESTTEISDSSVANRAGFRTKVGWLLIATATLIQLWRILNVHSNTGETPFLSANDRSRWCTILALNATGNYAIDDIKEIRDPQTGRRTWYSIDMVQHRGPDGKQHFYSSKPPLLPTLYAGVYWLIRIATGASLLSQPFFVARVMLIVVNLLPMVGFWCVMVRCAQRVKADWQFLMLASAVTHGTFLSTFIVTLNNHTPAAMATAISLFAVERIVVKRDLRIRWFVFAGLSASFAVANELPALAWLGLVTMLLATISPRKTLLIFVPATVPVTVAFFATNYVAHGTWRPAYSQRAVGKLIATIDTRIGQDLAELSRSLLIDRLGQEGIILTQEAVIRPARREGIWELWDEPSQWRIALRKDNESSVGLYQWGDWYDYPNSYWVEGKKQGVDKGEPNRLKYAFHCIVGDHGILSLTPFWLLAVLGAAVNIVGHCMRSQGTKDHLVNTQGQPSHADGLARRELSARTALVMISLAIVITTLVVIGFYLARPLEDRNYGGVCSGLRWAFWLIPLWFWLSVYGIQQLSSRAAIIGVALLLAISIFSTSYPWNNPWTSPWIDQLMGRLAQGY